MNSRTELISIVVSANAWRPRLVRTAYVFATAVATLGWFWTLGWLSFAIAKWLIA
jgi:hypothetical protein